MSAAKAVGWQGPRSHAWMSPLLSGPASWNTDQRSRLALDADGTAYFGYDAELTWSDACADRSWESCHF